MIVTQSCLTLCESMDCVACQAPLLMEFSRQEYWSGLPFPSPGNLPNPGIKHKSPALQTFFILWGTRETFLYNTHTLFYSIFLITLPKTAGWLFSPKLSNALIRNWGLSLSMKEILRVRIKDSGNILLFKHISIKLCLIMR